MKSDKPPPPKKRRFYELSPATRYYGSLLPCTCASLFCWLLSAWAPDECEISK